MTQLRDLPLVDAAVSEQATFGDAVAELLAARLPAIAVVDGERRVVGLFAEGDLLRGLFPDNLGELRHTAFLADDDARLDARARRARDRPVREFARAVVPLAADESQTHAAERFMHTGEYALPVVEGKRFVGMLSVSALCHARLDEVEGSA
jgi:CBS domain-containing protein